MSEFDKRIEMEYKWYTGILLFYSGFLFFVFVPLLYTGLYWKVWYNNDVIYDM